MRRVVSAALGAVLVAGSVVAGGASLTPPVASAEGPPAPGAFSWDTTEFYAFVDEGESLDVTFTAARGSSASVHDITVLDPEGVEQFACTVGSTIGDSCEVSALTGPAGVWTITQERIDPDDGIIALDWLIEADDAAGEDIPGRVWTPAATLAQDGGAGNLQDLELHLVNDTGYIYQVNLEDYNGIFSTIEASSVGVATPDCVPTYQSAPLPEVSGGDLRVDCEPRYRVFYDEPAADLPVTAPSAAGDVFVLPEVLVSDDLAVDDLSFTAADPNASAGTFSYSVNERFSGAYQLQIDVDGNGGYDDAVDVTIPLAADGSSEYVTDFDGLDGTGAPIEPCTLMNAQLYFPTVGELHVLQQDVEGRAGGIAVTRLNGDGAPDSTLRWDDTALSGDPINTTPVLDGTAGVDSSGGVHGWEFDNDSWGNARYIDDWAYNPIELSTGEIAFGAGCLEIDKSSDATADTRAGDEVTYTVTATNTGTSNFTSDDPAVVLDDLSDVVDDAVYGDDATADQPGELVYDEPLLSWTGPLAVGETVTITYTVTLASTGDGEVRNVAWVPDDPTDPTPPACDPPVDGTDPDTGQPCAENELLLPQLAVTKTSDTTEIPVEGGTVEYTVVVENTGAGDYTEEAPATVTDDLSEVLDDADYNGDAVASSGPEPTFAEPELTWSGPLAAGESVEITYSVTFTGGGDDILLNVACVDASQVPTGDAPCDPVQIPAAGLTQWKQVVASEDPVGAGTVLTYTLFFDSDGEAPATIDAVDNLVHVLDDGEVTVEPSSPDGLTVTRDGEVISIAGDVPAGETYAVVYEVTLGEDGERGDDVAANFLLDPGEEPPTEPVCEPTNEQLPDCTVTPVGAVEVIKDVVADSDPVDAGTVLTYTLTFGNTGAGPIDVDHTDLLADVLDDATLTTPPAASDDVLAVSEVADDAFTVTGTLPAGEVVMVTYAVTVNPAGERGNSSADNVVVPTGEDPPEECLPEDPTCTVTPVAAVEAAKSADPESGTAVEAGDEVTYTLTFTNTGTATGEVDHTDDLSGVLDDATFGEVTADEGLSATGPTDGALVVTGELPAGETATVTYTVVVGADGERGDNVLANYLVPTGEEPPAECLPEDPTCTTHPVGALEATKSVDPVSTTPVVEGQQLTYTLSFENTGAAPVAVDYTDDLSGVLDDATFGDVVADGGLEVVGPTDGVLAVTGAVPVGAVATVTYTVTVDDADQRGDDVLANFLLAPGEDPAQECLPESALCTTNPVGDIAASKSVDPETGSTVTAGTELTYTLAFENTGEAASSVDFTDHLDGVLDDADFGAVTADGGLDVSGPADGVLSITGSVPVGETALVTYTVVVGEDGQRGDDLLANFLVPAGAEPPAECDAANPLCTQNPINPGTDPVDPGDPGDPGDPDLPDTGTGAGLAVLGLGALGLGLALTVLGSRRRATGGTVS